MSATLPARFHTLDALRGVAAIAVMLYHAAEFSPWWMWSGYLAADLFFVLSGFVLAQAYEARLQDGMSVKQFMLARLQRIYPVFWLGALIGCALLQGSPLTVFMIPSPDSYLLFKANWPLWSLLTELVANLLWAVFAVRLSFKGLVGAAAGLGVILAINIIWYGTADLGAFWFNALPGLVRTCYSFLIGVILFRLYQRKGAARHNTPMAWLLVGLLLLQTSAIPQYRVVSDLISVGVVIPLIVWLGAHWEVPAKRFAAWLGGISFPLYCLHAPLVAFAHAGPLVMTALLIAMLGVATLVDRYYDRPIQAWFKARKQAACSPTLSMI